MILTKFGIRAERLDGGITLFWAIAKYINVSQPMRLVGAAADQNLSVSIFCDCARNTACPSRTSNWINQPRKNPRIWGVCQDCFECVLRDHARKIAKLRKRGKE